MTSNHNMKIGKEEWVEKVMNSANNIQKAEANTFLFEKIQQRLQTVPADNYSFAGKLIWKMVIGFALLAIINLITVKKFNSSHSHRLLDANEYFFNYNYNY